MGYPKWGFGVWGNGVPGIRTWVQRWSFGCRGLRNGGYESTLRAQNRIKGEREQSIFAIIRACKTASYSGIKHRINTLKTSDLSLYRKLIPNTLLLHPTPLEQQLPHYERRTMQWTKNLHLQLQLQKISWTIPFGCTLENHSQVQKNLYTPPDAWHGKNYGMAWP